MTALTDLRKMVISQKTTNLPAGPANPAFEALHSALQTYDGFVSERVIRAMSSQKIEVDPTQLRLVQAEVNFQFSQPALPAGRDLENYRKYKVRLDQMAGLLAAIKEDGTHA